MRMKHRIMLTNAMKQSLPHGVLVWACTTGKANVYKENQDQKELKNNKNKKACQTKADWNTLVPRSGSIDPCFWP